MKLKTNLAISETGFVFDPSTGDSYTLNPQGVEILELLKKKKNSAEIAKALSEKYDTTVANAEKDIIDFTAMLKHYGLIETEDEKEN